MTSAFARVCIEVSNETSCSCVRRPERSRCIKRSCRSARSPTRCVVASCIACGSCSASAARRVVASCIACGSCSASASTRSCIKRGGVASSRCM